MPGLGGNWNPAQIMMQSNGSGAPYLAQKTQTPGGSLPPANNTFGGQSIRPTGPNQGFDSAYLQNLATYALGQFAPQGSGTQNINPLNPGQNFGTPTGGGSAPVMGMPTTQLAQAQGAGGQTASTGGGGSPAQVLNMTDWIDQMIQQGSTFGLNGVGGLSGNSQ